MKISLYKPNKINDKDNIIVFLDELAQIKKIGFSKTEVAYIEKQHADNRKKIYLNQLTRQVVILFNDVKDSEAVYMESLRKTGNSLQKHFNGEKASQVSLIDMQKSANYAIALVEGMALGSYQFLKYKSDSEKIGNTLETLDIYSSNITETALNNLCITTEATYIARDLINEPLSYLTAEVLSQEIQRLGKSAGFKVDVLNKVKIESLKMGGLLAVNQGSIDPPTFNILEWKPAKAKNKKPIVLVGKGIVFDSGGLNIKTGTSMDGMKCDMSGAAAVASAIYAIAKAKIPVHVVGLIPATDNRPSGNAFAPGDVITMHNGKTVEIFSTDAEGRLILGDALSYAKMYNPEFVIDIATLTGAASRAIGKYGIVAMGNNDKLMQQLKDSGNSVCERIVEFPFWGEYDELIKSEIADLKNIGAAEAGAITAGKFLEHFTDYPWVHLDIAGPAFVDNKFNYRGVGGTGVGVRLFFDLVNNYNKK